MPLIKLVLTTFLQSFTNIFFMFLVLIVYWNIKRVAFFEETWLGFFRYKISDQLLERLLYGMLSGLMASFIIVILGITLDYRAILMIWPLAIFLMLFSPRYLCFSYAAGILSLVSLIFGWPDIDVSATIALVGVLHLIESILIYFDGYKSSVPVYMEHSSFNPIGAYIMQKMWPIPLVVLLIPDSAAQLAGSGINMPSWWPIFQSQGAGGMLAILPMVAILGYGDIAITQTPRDRAKKSGITLTIYSVTVLTLAVISSRIYWVKYLAAVSAPALHEFVIIKGKREQTEGAPLFSVPWKGIRILEVFPDSIGEAMGLKQGDILLSINGKSVNSIKGAEEILSDSPSFVWLEVKRGAEEIILEGKDFQEGISDLGVMFIPRNTGKYFRMEDEKGIIIKWWNSFKQKHNAGVGEG